MVHGLTIFISAFLLFQVQFIVGKHLLPWFGGTPGVWSTCLVFFQTLLLGGYGYAHWLTIRNNPRRQALIHTLLLVVAAIWLLAAAIIWRGTPLLAGEPLKPEPGDNPARQLILVLLASVGVPFLTLAATAPLVQHWHAQSGNPLQRTYRLYALSNAGSLLGLLSYPFAVEVLFDLGLQAWIWAGLFAVFATACAIVAWRSARQAPPAALPLAAPPSPVPAAAPPAAAATPPEAPTRPDTLSVVLWVLLPFTASLMLVATTNRLCQDVAVVPFLWMLPLALYLVTFIISFDHPRWYSRRQIAPAAAATVAVLYTFAHAATTRLSTQLAVFGLFLFLFCLIAHGEVARLRPGRAHLTLFYLAIATGGALGSAAVSLLAPAVFEDFWEFHGGIVLGWLVFAVAWWRDRESPFFRGDPLQFALLTGTAVFFVTGLILNRFIQWDHTAWWLAAAFAGNLTMIVGRPSWRRAYARRGLWSQMFVGATVVAGAVGLGKVWREARTDQIVVGRNFYGVLRLRLYQENDDTLALQLTHGSINHGVQLRSDDQRMEPTTYYSRGSGVGLAVQELQRAHNPGSLHLGVLGLGTGTLAAYAQPGDRVRFYEINPLVMMLSLTENPIFTFLSGSAGDITVVPGDARLALERELAVGAPQEFDLLAVDVFSSDAIPVHLLTVEACAVYRRHLRNEQSILAIHTSNRFLDLEPVVAATARRLNLHGIVVSDSGHGPAAFSSTWVLLSGDQGILDRIADAAEEAWPLGPPEVLFTDRYSNLFRILER